MEKMLIPSETVLDACKVDAVVFLNVGKSDSTTVCRYPNAPLTVWLHIVDIVVWNWSRIARVTKEMVIFASAEQVESIAMSTNPKAVVGICEQAIDTRRREGNLLACNVAAWGKIS